MEASLLNKTQTLLDEKLTETLAHSKDMETRLLEDMSNHTETRLERLVQDIIAQVDVNFGIQLHRSLDDLYAALEPRWQDSFGIQLTPHLHEFNAQHSAGLKDLREEMQARFVLADKELAELMTKANLDAEARLRDEVDGQMAAQVTRTAKSLSVLDGQLRKAAAATAKVAAQTARDMAALNANLKKDIRASDSETAKKIIAHFERDFDAQLQKRTDDLHKALSPAFEKDIHAALEPSLAEASTRNWRKNDVQDDAILYVSEMMVEHGKAIEILRKYLQDLYSHPLFR